MVRSVTTATGPAYRAQRLTLPSSERTWTVVGGDHHLVEPAEGYLEYLRAQRASPNTVKSYARALALWWQFLDAFGLRWDAVTVEHFGAFLSWLRTGDEPAVASIERRPARFAESTIAARLRAVISCYDYHVLNGVDVGRDLHRITDRGGGRYKPLLEHVARRKGRRRAVVRIRDRRRAAPPILTPQQIELICEACASWDAEAREWRGSVRNRLLWMLLAETGLRLGEALGLQHRDWHTGRGDTPFIEVVDREHPHGVRAKSGYRRLYVSDDLDRLYGEHVWRLCEAGADLAAADPAAAVRPPPTSTPATCLSISTGSRGSRRGDRSRSTTWWSGCAAGWPGGCRRPGHHTGCAIRMPPRCCCRGCRCTWSVADSDTPTCRPRSPPTPT